MNFIYFCASFPLFISPSYFSINTINDNMNNIAEIGIVNSFTGILVIAYMLIYVNCIPIITNSAFFNIKYCHYKILNV